MNKTDIQKQIMFFIFEHPEPLNTKIKAGNRHKLLFLILIFNLILLFHGVQIQGRNNKVRH